MRYRASIRESGLILLVVLGMLTLFSMLTITYIVFTGQSRAASMAMARREYRGTPAPRLTDEALRQLLRGTTDSKSAAYGHSFLEDVYAPPFQLQARSYSLDLNSAGTVNAIEISREPFFLGGRFLRIPLHLEGRTRVLDYTGAGTYHYVANNLPAAHDVLNGRIITFQEGPLANESFRIVRYIGALSVPSNNASMAQLDIFQLQYSIVIDLNDANKHKMVDYQDGNMTIENWIARTPEGSYLSHTWNRIANPAVLAVGHRILLNGAPLNGHGLGMALTGAPQPHLPLVPPPANNYVSPFTGYPFKTDPPPELANFPVSLQPRYGALRQASGLPLVPIGLANESYDAADYNDFYLSLRASESARTGLAVDKYPTTIIPSFHRAALINYIVNWKDPLASYSNPEELLWTLERIQLAAGRPLSINVTVANPPISYIVNPNFTGNNPGDYVAGTGIKTPQLNLTIGNWTNQWPGPPGGPKDQFLNWVRWLVAGPWDVDNDGDALADSVWVDLNLPLITSPEGKLLKMLTAYYVEDFDGKLDLNATGNIAQTLDAGYTNNTTNQFAEGANLHLPQGFGTGPAEISIRHLFASPTNYLQFLAERYRSSTVLSDVQPGSMLDDAAGQLMPRERFPNNAMGRLLRNQLPAFPSLTHGVMALGLDRLGNPLMLNNVSPWDQSLNDPYEARWRKLSHADSPYTLDDWERLIRTNDWDRSTYDNRLASRAPASRQSIAPKTAHFRHPVVSSRSGGVALSSLFELVNMVMVRRNVLPQGISAEGFRELFPLEFHRGERLNANRPFGNGIDDNGDGQIDEPRELIGILSNLGWVSSQHTQTSSTKDSLRLLPDPSQVNLLREDYLFGQPHSTAYSNFEAVPMKAGSPDENTYWGGVESRQLFARHLYCLAQLLVPADYKFPNVPANHNVTPQERARLLAQWAVNAVDFRDADSAMTRFPYDSEPFKVKRTMPANPQSGDIVKQVFAWEPDDGVVWGMEQPELLLTESLATHDIRAKKSDPTNHYQYRIPQGSLFLELYCPRSSPTNIAPEIHVPGFSRKLYNSTNGALKLGELSPPDAAGTEFPVWRIYISESKPEVDPNASKPDRTNQAFHLSHKSGTTLNPLNYTFQFPSDPHDGPKTWNNNSPKDSGFKFDHSGELKDPDPSKARIIVFTSGFAPTNSNTPGIPTGAVADDHVFVNQQANVELAGGEYLVIGPRAVTYFGSRKQNSGTPTHQPNTHRIEFSPTWTNIYKHGSNTVLNPPVPQRQTMADSKYMIAAAPIPTTWKQPQPPLPQFNPIGINVSEPLPKDTGYYKEPEIQLNPNDNGTDVATGAEGFGKLPYDAYNGQGPLFDKKSSDTPLEHWGLPGELNGSVPVEQGTQEDWCTAFLQRLADPDKPYHVRFNPYITVDWLPIDLTVFNGEDDRPSTDSKKFRFASRQKTGVAINASSLLIDVNAPPQQKTFYSYHTPLELPETGANATFTDVYFDRELSVDDLSHDRADKDYAVGKKSFSTLGFLNSSFELTEPVATVAPGFLGAPKNVPHSPLWLNRPFTNALELTWVPLSSPGQFMQEFTGDASTNTYASSNNGFAHLLNFFAEPTVTNFVPDYPASMLLELVETPSPWSDTDEFVPPADVISATALATLRAPYNRLPGFVEPGKVNLNTLTEENVFHGLLWNYLTPNSAKNALASSKAAFDLFASNRQGYIAPNSPGDNPFLHPHCPTQFAGVFKSPLEAGIVPNTRQNVLDWAARLNPIHTTLMRGQIPPIANAQPPNKVPNTVPLFSPATNANENHVFKKYLPFTRLANLVTTRSNVFSVRITIGYFEFDTSTGLGVEYGAEQGKARRHRSFYVVDRSQVVGFQVGQDTNTDKCILLRRVIE